MNALNRQTRPMSRGSGWKLAVIFGFSTLLVFGLLLARVHTASAATSPTITSDQQDYQPGATVTLTGASWTSGDDVQIYVNDSVGNTWSLTSGQNGAPPDPIVDSNGGFTYSFQLPNTFIANYTATATDKTIGSTASTTFTDTNPVCNKAPATLKTDNQVGASYTTSGNTATYTFSSFFNESSLGGIPGLIEYCVLTTPLPDSNTVVAIGADTSPWTFTPGSNGFAFGRPDGDPSNIPLNGTNTTMGTATWSGGVPTSQTIVLHVNDPTECSALYGSGTLTCFVTPGTKPQPGKDLTVSKTATPSFTRTYTWGISKSVDQTQINIAQGDSATANYTVSVTHDSGTDSNWQVTGKITVSNPNSFDVTGVNVTDAIDNGGQCTVASGTNLTVPAGQSVDLDYTCTYSSAPNPLKGTNTATASWSKDQGNGNSTPDSSATGTATADFSTTTPTIVDGSVTVTDTFGGTLGTVSYTGPSPTTFTYSKTFSGDPAGTCTDHNNTATFTTDTTNTTGSASQKVKVCVGADLTVSKTATPSFTRTFTWEITKSVDHSTIDTSGPATANYTVSVTHDAGTDSGWAVSGTITVTNPNDWEAITTDVTDAVDNGGTCSVTSGTGVIVPANSSKTLNYSCTFTSGSSGNNTATATWNKATYFTPDGSAASDPVSFAFTTPTTIVDGSVTVTDTLKGSLGTVKYTDPSPTTFTYPLTFNDPAGICTTHDNTATFTTNDTGATGSASQSVKVCVGADLQITKDATPTFTRTYTWTITKSVDQSRINIASGGSAMFNYTVSVSHDNGSDSNWQVAGKITVTNPNDWEPITANVTDAIDNGGTCTVTGGSGVSVPASSLVTLDYTCTYASAPSSSSGSNTATATWDATAASTPDGSASGTATANFTTPTTIVDGSVTVTDSLGGLLGTVGLSDQNPATFTYPITFTSDPAGTCTMHPNTATFTTSDTGTTGSASQTVKVCVGADLTVSKTATPYFTRTYNWSITKSVKSPIEQLGGGTATANYTVVVSENPSNPFTDSAWQVSGTITVSNPNDWEPITANVTDAIDNGGTCTVTGGSGVSVPASGNVKLTYTCTFNSNPGSGTNTATATWVQSAAYTPDSSASNTATYTFGAPTKLVNQYVTVIDAFNGGTPTTLGTAGPATDSTPFYSKIFTYTRTVNVPASNCTTYPNIATIVETGQQAKASVEVCGPAKTGALTMGYWQNKNGQSIITNGASTGGVCNSGTWLRQYAPFQDLSATASCSAVATYVSNIINAANAGGSTMNAMLKAQMLATALDVYFSDPALGGNKINAPAPIGGVTIDLTKICKMTDSSSGGTCSGSFENVSGAFGGATSLTVSQMLAYAASQSNVGGSFWYANVKATQQWAKDAFDAINNQVAFAP